MDSFEIFDNKQQFAPANKVKVGEHTYIREDLVDKEITEFKQRLEITEHLRQKALNEGLKVAERDRDIIEGLQKQLEEKEHLLETFRKLKREDNEIISNYKTDLYGLKKSVEEIKKIKLRPEEKEIFYKGFEHCERQCANQIASLTLENKELKQLLDERNTKEEEALDAMRCFYFEEVSNYKKGIINAIKSMADTYSISSPIYIKTDEFMDKLYAVIKKYERFFYGK